MQGQGELLVTVPARHRGVAPGSGRAQDRLLEATSRAAGGAAL